MMASMTTTPWARAAGRLAGRVLLAGAQAAAKALVDELDRVTTEVTR